MSKWIAAACPVTAAAGLTVDTSMPCDPSNYSARNGRTVSYIVLHYTGNASDSAWGNANYFRGGDRQASAHYFVDESSVYQSVSPRDKAWHCGADVYRHAAARNENSVGIEMCTSGGYRVSEATQRNAAALTAAWCRLLGYGADDVDEYVVRHYDVTGKRCPAQMAGEGNGEWTAFKQTVKAALGGSAAQPAAATNSGEEMCKVELPVLHRGSDSGYVRTAQILLNRYFDAGLAEDGGFGPATERAVLAYQRDRGLTADGWIGAQTWRQLLC